MWHILTLLDALEAEPGGLSVAALLLVLPASGNRGRHLLLAAPFRLLLLEPLDPLTSLVVIVVILLKEGYEDTWGQFQVWNDL